MMLLAEKKGGFAGDISTWSWVQIPPRPSTTNPGPQQIFCKGLLPFSEELLAFQVADVFKPGFDEFAYILLVGRDFGGEFFVLEVRARGYARMSYHTPGSSLYRTFRAYSSYPCSSRVSVLSSSRVRRMMSMR